MRAVGRPIRARTTAAVCTATVVVSAFLVGNSQAHESAITRANCTAPASVVRAWVGAWKTKDFKRMVALSQVQWRLTTPRPVERLEAYYGFKDVLGYRYLRCTIGPFPFPGFAAGNVFARVTFRVRYQFGAPPVKNVRITANVIREDRRGYPSATGQWGVNPLSTLRED